MSEGPPHDKPFLGMQPPNQDIYQQGPDPLPPRRRRRRRWLSLGRKGADQPSPASAVSTGPALRPDLPPREEHQRRRHRRRSEHSPRLDLINRLTWISVTGVAVAYLALLVAVEGWRRTHPRPPPPRENPASVTVSNRPATTETRLLTERMAAWQRGLRLQADWRLQRGNQAPAEAVVQAMSKVLAEVPDFTQARLELALALERKKEYAAARDQFLEVLDNDPGSGEARLGLARVYLALQDPVQALNLARWIIELDALSSAAHEIAAEALMKQNVPAEAITHLKKLASLNRDNIGLHNNLGLAYLKAGDFRSALQTFREVLRLDEGNSVAHYNLAVTYAQQGLASNTVDVLTEASRRFGSSFVMTWARGAEFEPVAEDPVFVQFLTQNGTGTPAGSTNAP